jgi:hypothetical protein
MKLNIGAKITHPVYGQGVVLDSWLSKSVLKSQSTENYAIKFDDGGPMGFAEHATNDTRSLTKVDA